MSTEALAKKAFKELGLPPPGTLNLDHLQGKSAQEIMAIAQTQIKQFGNSKKEKNGEYTFTHPIYAWLNMAKMLDLAACHPNIPQDIARGTKAFACMLVLRIAFDHPDEVQEYFGEET